MLTDGVGASSIEGAGKLTKAKMIAELVQLVGFSEKEATAILEYILDSVARAIKHGDKVEIRGFGTFGTRQRKGRVGRNPKTGARVEVPTKKIPFFKPSKELRDIVMKL
jgi:integration host factor subunit beta